MNVQLSHVASEIYRATYRREPGPAATRHTSTRRNAMAGKTLPTRHHGVLRRDRRTGRFVKVYTLTYTDPNGPHVRTLSARGIEIVGRVLNRIGERGEAWDIAVTDKDGDDVTFGFACFT